MLFQISQGVIVMIRVSCAFKISEIFSGLVAAFRLQIITPVQNPSATHIGEGEPPIVLEEIRRKWTGLEGRKTPDSTKILASEITKVSSASSW